MAFSALTPLSQDQYEELGLTTMGAMNVAIDEDPDPSVSINLGGWKGNNILGFTISNEAKSSSTITIDGDTVETLDVEVEDSAEGNAVVSYFSVDVGTDNRLTDWTINFVVKKNKKTTGKWVFTKGKSDDDILPA